MDYDYWDEHKGSIVITTTATQPITTLHSGSTSIHPGMVNDISLGPKYELTYEPDEIAEYQREEDEYEGDLPEDEETEASNELFRQMIDAQNSQQSILGGYQIGTSTQAELAQHHIIQNHHALQQAPQQYKLIKLTNRMSNSPTSLAMSSSGSSSVSSSGTGTPVASYHIRDKPGSSFSLSGNICSMMGQQSQMNANTSSASPPNMSEAICAVCGDGHAKLHYGVLACYGCKGFFRRTLTGKYRYVCRFGNNCIVDKYQRNSCRYCRFNRCLQVGMDPKAVRPDRDLTGKQKVPRARKRQMDEELINHMMRLQGDDWSRKIPVEAKVLLMQLLNIESKVAKGDTSHSNLGSHPPKMTAPSGNTSKNVSLRELFEQKPSLSGRRSEMGYEPYRIAKAEELSRIAHRSAIAAVDWVDSLSEIGEFMDTEDKIALVKSCYAPLTIFNFSARTAENTKNPDILCLCSYSYVPRNLPPEFDGSNHLSNNLIDRTLNELVTPLRKLNLREEEVVPLKAIIILNPNAKGLSAEAQQRVSDLRDKVQDMLFQIVKELRPVYNASSRFGNLLLLLPTITTLSGVMCENMQFCQVFGNRTKMEPLLSELFEDTKGNQNNNMEEITSSTSAGLLTPPLLENPADISLHSIVPNNYSKVTQNGNQAEKADSYTQTENPYCSDDCCSPLTCMSNSNSLINDYSPHAQSQGQQQHHNDDDPLSHVSLSPFPNFESNLLDDCELADSSTFSPGAAQQLRFMLGDSAECNDLFGLIQ
ncbi:zinc finger, c4 type (two domains) domain-containing protein [Ditylenchus destructor]|nr:zinc finger, c4 type (two domains) domain-containing protein [Ditylenchus destructor]